jgi:urate oxidase
MGTAVLDAHPEIVEIKLKAPNKHHFDYDIERFGVEQHGEVFHADDRPYGLIEATIARDDAPPAGEAWKFSAGTA